MFLTKFEVMQENASLRQRVLRLEHDLAAALQERDEARVALEDARADADIAACETNAAYFRAKYPVRCTGCNAPSCPDCNGMDPE